MTILYRFFRAVAAADGTMCEAANEHFLASVYPLFCDAGEMSEGEIFLDIEPMHPVGVTAHA